jgi:hypothetical protein
MTSHLEVSQCSLGDWKKAIFMGYDVWRQVGVQPGYAQIGTRCKVMLRKCLKTIDFTLFRYRIERILSCENITKKGHLWASLKD